MAKSATERKREQRAREAAALDRLGDDAHPYLAKPFFEHVQQDPNWSTIEAELDLLGIDPPSFDDDSGPEDFSNPGAFGSDEDRDEHFRNYPGSVGRAEVLVDGLLTVATELAVSINTYKKAQLTERLHELEAADLSDMKARKAAFKDVTKIQKILDELEKKQRVDLPKWKVKGT
ncbi:hypothetical protein [Vannielia litorea]|uniref:hypothetical protein n=1 Tax=Vannielia litorea TaxID=1217970 RepID=UPI001BCFE1F0|nr:hypothetical protein [Vannielia litorea]MBS8227212.1 hypothetical protein [Vannielia litorea]